VIVRASATIPTPTPTPAPDTHAQDPQKHSQPTAGPSKPASKRSKTASFNPPASKSTSTDRSHARPKSKTQSRAVPPLEEHELAIEEDVRRMDQEAESLRRKSQAHTPSKIPSIFEFSTSSGSDSLSRLPGRETPQIERNKAMRELGVDASGGAGRRRVSGGRGKRLSSSFENSGVIGQ
jgi:kinetochore protein Mis13/DSN1